MKHYFLLILITCSFNLHAQVSPSPLAPFQTAYGITQFNTPFYDLENRWVIIAKNQQRNKYVFGMVYLDMQAGFSYHVEGTFGIDPQGKAYRDSTDYIKNGMIVLRIGPVNTPLCPMPDAMLADLHVKPIPDWLATYHPTNQDRNTVTFKIAYGKFLNGSGAAAKALGYLEDAYKIQPHAPGLEFELSYAYNVLNRYPEAITVLSAAMANAPDNPVFYTELGYSYLRSKDNDNAINIYTKGISLAKQQNNAVARMGMTTNLTVLYIQLQQFDKAVTLINDYITDAPNNVSLYILLAGVYTKANDVDNAVKSYTKAIDIANPQDMETKARLAWSIALIYRDLAKNTNQYTTWGRKAKEWVPANGQMAMALRAVSF